MSRIGKQPVAIPYKTEVKKDGDVITVKGPFGEMSRTFTGDAISIKIGDSEIVLTPVRLSPAISALWGAYAAHLKNMIEGVNKPFKKALIIEGVGYKAELSGKELVFSVGFSHKVRVAIPEDISATVEKDTITISGVDKEKVGLFAARIRAVRKPEPYKGKGIRYADEVVRRKQGKRAA